MSKNILQALGKIDVALGGNTDDAANVIDALDQISERAGSLKNSVDNINSMELKVCESGEYDAETGVPTIEDPVKGTFYLTPAKNEEDNNIFNEYYVNDDGQWEMFGSASINVNDLFDLSDRMAKGIDDNGNIVDGAIIEGTLSGSGKNKASGPYSHAEGNGTTASGYFSHAEGGGTIASGNYAHVEGYGTTASGTQSHAEGNNTTASGVVSHAEGGSTIASGQQSHAEGYGGTFTINGVSYTSEAKGMADHTEGYQTRTVSGQPGNHAEGYQTAAIGGASHAEGSGTIASGGQSHAEGSGTTASGSISHAEGNSTIASGDYSHAEGVSTRASGQNSHAEGNSTIANRRSQHVFGEFNIEDPSSGSASSKGTYVEIVGNGTYNVRSNARTLDWNGNEVLAGKLTIGAGPTGNMDVATKQYVDEHAGLQNFVDGSATGSVRGIGTAAENNDYTIGQGAVAEGSGTKASGSNSHAEGIGTKAFGNGSHAENSGTTASGLSSHAEGGGTTASGIQSHAEGAGTRASGQNSHTEGGNTTASGDNSHAEGGGTIAAGNYSHAEGSSNNFSSKTINDQTYTKPGAYGQSSHSEGQNTLAIGNNSHAEGSGTTASGNVSHAEGYGTTASGGNSHAEGAITTASGLQAHAEGINTTASGEGSHTEGNNTIANHKSQHVFGEYNIEDPSSELATKKGIYVEIVGNGTYQTRSNARTLDWNGNEILAGKLTIGTGPTNNMDVATKQYVDEHAGSGSGGGSGLQNFVDGSATGSMRGIGTATEDDNYTIGQYAVAEGAATKASGYDSHAEGVATTASGENSHAEGGSTTASGMASHAEGTGTIASGYNSHAEGSYTTAQGVNSHAEGSNTIASGNYSHAEGGNTIANHKSQHVFGEFNIEDSSTAAVDKRGNYVEIVGNGTSIRAKSNARTLDWSGNETLAGSLTLGKGTADEVTITAAQLKALLAKLSS